MVILDESGAVVESPDYDKGRVQDETIDVTYEWIVDSPEEGEWVTVAEYPNGGKDQEWRVTKPEEGHWEVTDSEGNPVEHYDGIIPDDWPHEEIHKDRWTFQRYIAYTDEELSQIAEAKAEAERASRVSAQMQTATLLFVRSAAPSMTDAQAMSVSELFESWGDILAAGGTCEADTIIRHDGELYRVAQTHPAQAQYEPGAAGTESLYTHITMTPEGIEVWQQPTGAHDAYSKGDRVLYPDESGSIYESLIDGNTWSPDAYPAGWQKVPA